MSSDNDPLREPTVFSAMLTPHRSLSGAGFIALMLLIGGLNLVGGLIFLIAGAWPVVGFLGLDVLLIYWAFRASYRSAAAYEQVIVTVSELKVRKVNQHGQTREWTFNPLWVKLDRKADAEFGLQRLFLVSHGRKLPVAGFLSPAERESFAAALASALGEARRGPARAVIT